MVDAMLRKINLTKKEWNSSELCRLSIIYDRPDILQQLEYISHFEHILTTYCKVLERPRCKDVISKNKYGENQTALSETVVNKLTLLREFYDDVNIRDEILLSLDRIKLEKSTGFNKEDFLQFYSKRIPYNKRINSTAYKVIEPVREKTNNLGSDQV